MLVSLDSPPAKKPPGEKRLSFGASVPWDVWIAQNQVLNREIIDWTGYEPWAIGLARNKYERLERLFDGLSWLVIGIAAPIVLDKVFNRHWTQQLLKKFKSSFLSLPELAKHFQNAKKVQYRPIGMPFELLDKAAASQPDQKALECLKDHGLNALPKALADKILKYKVLILWFDLLIMASKGQLYPWGKNWVTEKLSGKHGFSGEFQDASEEYLKLKSKGHETSKTQKLWISLLTGYGSACALPLILLGLLKSKTPRGAKTIVGQLKRVIPALNYFDVVYMSKWVILWHTFFNWNLSSVLAARDNHERRETLTRQLATDFFYFIGDDIFSAAFGKFLEKRYQDRLKGIKLVKTGAFGLPRAVSLGEFHQMAQKFKDTEQKSVQALAHSLLRLNFIGSIITTALCLGLSINLLNNWYTRKKVLQEQADLQRAGKLQRPKPTNPLLAPSQQQSYVPKPQQMVPMRLAPLLQTNWPVIPNYPTKPMPWVLVPNRRPQPPSLAHA